MIEEIFTPETFANIFGICLAFGLIWFLLNVVKSFANFLRGK